MPPSAATSPLRGEEWQAVGQACEGDCRWQENGTSVAVAGTLTIGSDNEVPMRFSTLFLCAFLTTAAFVGGRTTAQQFAGWDPYSPTKLEWARLELQADLGESLTADSPMSVDFVMSGQKLVCYIAYTRSVSATQVAMRRKSIRDVFEIRKKGLGWNWLELGFEERTLETKR